MTGTVPNVIAVLLGGSIGTASGNRFPAKIQETVMHGLGLIRRHSLCRQPGAGVLLRVGRVASVQGGRSALAMGAGGSLGEVSRETVKAIRRHFCPLGNC